MVLKPESPYIGRPKTIGPVIEGNLAKVAEPGTEPITTAEAKKHLRVDFSTDDDYIDTLITAARQYCETKQSRIYIQTSMTFEINFVPGVGREIRLPVLPLVSIDAVKIIQTGVADVTVNAAQYDTDLKKGRAVLNDDFAAVYDTDLMPIYNSFLIEFKAGYGTAAANVPAKIKHAIKLIIGHWYEHREEASDGREVRQIPIAAKRLLGIDQVY